MRCLFVCLLGLVSQFVFAHDRGQTRADDHAPIGVMGDHTHDGGEWMLSYRFMHMEMKGNRQGNDKISTAEVLSDFIVSPIDMTMDMHMFGGMYAPNDELTFMLMLPYVEMSMDHVTRMGAEFNTTSSGIGDIKLSVLYKFFQRPGHKLHLNLGVGIPTGNIHERGDTPLGNVVLPYPMQIGSGSYDLMTGLTYNAQVRDWSWGAQVMGTFRLQKNDENYSLGDRFETSLWFVRNWNPYLSTSVRFHGQSWENIEGEDSRITRFNMMGTPIVPTAQPNLRGGSRLDFMIGANFYMPEGSFKGHRLAIEAGVPLQQNLDGPQLESDWLITVGWQKAF